MSVCPEVSSLARHAALACTAFAGTSRTVNTTLTGSDTTPVTGQIISCLDQYK